MIVIFILLSILLGLAVIFQVGHVAYEEGIQDERRKWYIHADCYGWKEEDFNPLEDNEE